MSVTSKVHQIETNDESMSCPKAKRSRGQVDVSEAPWKNAISALSTCVSSQDCMEALSKSTQIFNHSNERIHDEEIASGADAVLCRLLGFLCAKGSFDDVAHADQASSVPASAQPARATRVSDETVYTCQITEMVYRCSKAALEPSFQKVGPDFVNIIAKVFAYQLRNHPASNTRPDQESASHLKELKSANRLLLTITKILCHFARVQTATVSMASHPKLLSLMISLLRHPFEYIPFEAHHNTLWVLANMACCNENMQHMISQDRLMDTIIQTANIMHQGGKSRPIYQHALRLKHSAFRCLLNLSWDQANKILLSERDDLVATIGKAVEIRTLPENANDARNAIGTMLLQTRMFALGTLRNIAHTPSPQKIRLCTIQDGMILNLLCSATQSDEHTTIRDKAFAVIFNLVSPDTAELLISHPRLLDSMVEASSVLANLQGSNTAESASTMSFRSLNALEQAVASRGPEECHIKVRHAINQVNMARQFHDMAVPPE